MIKIEDTHNCALRYKINSKMCGFLNFEERIEDWPANFEDLTLNFKEIEDSLMYRDPLCRKSVTNSNDVKGVK